MKNLHFIPNILIVHAIAIRIGQKWQRTHIHKTNSCTQLGEAACTHGAHIYTYISFGLGGLGCWTFVVRNVFPSSF
jgi:hypothetical protein